MTALTVLRELEEFRDAHPEWVIEWDTEWHVWRGLRAFDGGEDFLTRRGLREMLDAVKGRA